MALSCISLSIRALHIISCVQWPFVSCLTLKATRWGFKKSGLLKGPREAGDVELVSKRREVR